MFCHFAAVPTDPRGGYGGVTSGAALSYHEAAACKEAEKRHTCWFTCPVTTWRQEQALLPLIAS